MQAHDETRAVEVFSGSIYEAEILKSILADNKIDSYLQDEYMGTMAPWNVAPGGVGSVKVVVSSDDLERAQPIVDDYRNRPEVDSD